MSGDDSLSSYLNDLPALYRQESTGGRPDFFGRFLLAFEHVLTGVGDANRPGLEEILEGIVTGNGDIRMAGTHRYLTPGPAAADAERAPAEFLEWLSGWVALTLRDDWNDDERRRILAEIVPTYSRRGTPDGLKQILAAFSGVSLGAITIEDDTESDPAHHFTVTAVIPGAADLARRRAVLQAIVDLEKPAHTYYELSIETPTMQVGKTSSVGKDTVIGAPIRIP